MSAQCKRDEAMLAGTPICGPNSLPRMVRHRLHSKMLNKCARHSFTI